MQTETAWPRWGNAFTRALGRGALQLMGWRLEVTLPAVPKFVVIGAPHTSNFDGVLAIAALMALGIRVNVYIKHSAFRWPFRGVLSALGFFPVQRDRAHGIVDATVAAMRARPAMVLGLAPEGTRSRAPNWKQGFHRIARALEVPILCCALDYGQKRIVTGPLITPGDDYAADLRTIRDFYAPMRPRRPERWSLPEL